MSVMIQAWMHKHMYMSESRHAKRQEIEEMAKIVGYPPHTPATTTIIWF